MLSVVEKTASEVFIPFTVGGGIKTLEDIRDLLKAGADKVSINTSGILNQKLISDSAQKFGSQCIVVAVDAKKKDNSWNVFSHGGTKDTGMNVLDWLLKVQKLGAGEILLTSMDRDGTKQGYDLNLLKLASKILEIPVIASGGVGELKHFRDGIIVGGANALLAASVFHFAKFSILEVKEYLKKEKIAVRF
jgi:cyclase